MLYIFLNKSVVEGRSWRLLRQSRAHDTQPIYKDQSEPDLEYRQRISRCNLFLGR